MTIDEMIAVLQSHKDGKAIQRRKANWFRTDGKWEDVNSPAFNFMDCEYRVKPEPRTVFVIFNRDGEPVNVVSNFEGFLANGFSIFKFIEAQDQSHA